MKQQWLKTNCGIALILLGALVAAYPSTTIEYNGSGPDFGSRHITYQPDVGVPDGNEVRIGYFTVNFDLAANAGNLSALSSAWRSFDNTFTVTFADSPGCFNDFMTQDDPQFDNQRIYLWAFKTTDNAAALPDNSNVSHYGLFSSTGSDPTWLFPPTSAQPPANSKIIDAFQVDRVFWGTIPEGSLQLAQVPEPSTACLFILGLGTIFGGAAAFGPRRRTRCYAR